MSSEGYFRFSGVTADGLRLRSYVSIKVTYFQWLTEWYSNRGKIQKLNSLRIDLGRSSKLLGGFVVVLDGGKTLICRP